MATGESYVNVTNKGILGFEDFGDRMLGYLRSLNIESVLARFDVDGSFATKLGLGSGGNDTVQVTGTSRITDGLGHVMKIHECAGGQNALFQNQSGITYYVGARYCEVATGIVINPRTGNPEYLAYTEEVGEQDAPDLVTDNGNGTITFRVDTICEPGVSCAGRTVRVYLADPQATTALEAFEDLTVVWDGSNNKVTSADVFGQTSVSTTAADYVVTMLGPTVLRLTNLETSPDHMFIGTVIGTGAGNPPTTFNTDSQRLLKTFEDASQILFTPYGFISVTNVQEAIQQILTTYANEGSSSPGGDFIGLNVVTFNKRAPSADSTGYGIGNLADSTFTSDRDLQLVLEKVDEVFSLRRFGTVTLADGTTKTIGDYVSVDAVDDAFDHSSIWSGAKCGVVFLQDGSYTCTKSEALGVGQPWVIGETGALGDSNTYVPIALSNGNNPLFFKGQWNRVHLKTSQATYGWEAWRGCRMEEISAQVGQLKVWTNLSGSVIDPGPYLNGVNVKDFDTLTNLNSAGIKIDSVSSGTYTRDAGVVERVCVATDDSPAIVVDNIAARPADSAAAALIVRNSVFYTSETIVPVATITDSDVTFENCLFIGPLSTGSYVMTASGTGRVVFKDCTFIARECQVVNFTADAGGFENCDFFTGSGTTVSDPIMVKVEGGKHGTWVKNCRVFIQGSRTGTPTGYCVKLGDGDGHINVDGLYVTYASGVLVHSNDTLEMRGSDGGGANYKPQNTYTNVTVDFENAATGATLTATIIRLLSVDADDTIPIARNFTVHGLDHIPAGGTPTVLFMNRAILDGFHFDARNVPAGASQFNKILDVYNHSIASNVYINVNTSDTYANNIIGVGLYSTLRDCRVDFSGILADWGVVNVYNSGSIVDGLRCNDLPYSRVLLDETGSHNTMINIVCLQNAIDRTNEIMQSAGDYAQMSHLRFHVNSQTGSGFTSTGAAAILTNSHFINDAGAFPYTFSGSGSIQDNNYITT